MPYFNYHEAYRILGIDEGSDIKEVKNAYAALIKQYHPEEHPEEWKKIHDAYTFLCDFIKSGKKAPVIADIGAFDISDDIPVKSESAPEKDEEQILLDNLINEAKKESGAASYGTEDDISEREYFSEIMALLEKLQSPGIVLYGKPVIKADSFMVLHNHEKFEQAMRYPAFISRLTEVLGKSSPDPDIRSYLEGDVIKIFKAGLDSPIRSEYPKLLKAAETSITKDGFMAAVKLEEDKNSGAFSKRNKMPSLYVASVLIISLLVMCKWAATQHSKPSTDFTLPEVTGTYTPMELPVPVEMVFYTENTDVKTVLEDYEQLIEDCEEFFEKYDIEDCDDPEVQGRYDELKKMKMKISLFEITYKPDQTTSEGRNEYEKLSGYHSALEEVWEDWDLGTP